MSDSTDRKNGGGLSNLMHEERHFDPPEELAKNANVTADAYAEADKDRVAFWGKQAERISWAEPFDEVLDWSNPPFAKWYVGGKLNAAYNCVDRHVENGKGDKVAFHWVQQDRRAGSMRVCPSAKSRSRTKSSAISGTCQNAPFSRLSFLVFRYW